MYAAIDTPNISSFKARVEPIKATWPIGWQWDVPFSTASGIDKREANGLAVR